MTITSPSLPCITFSISLLDYRLFSVLLPSNSYLLCFSLPPNHSQSKLSALTHHHHHHQHPSPLPPSHLFLWPWSTRLNASTLLPIISRTQLCDCPPPWLLLPFVLQTGLSHRLFYSGQNPTSLNRQRDSWSVYCLCVCVCVPWVLGVCVWTYVCVPVQLVNEGVVICLHSKGKMKPSAVLQSRVTCSNFYFYKIQSYYIFFQDDTFCYCFSLIYIYTE